MSNLWYNAFLSQHSQLWLTVTVWGEAGWFVSELKPIHFFHKETIRKENTFQPLFKNVQCVNLQYVLFQISVNSSWKTSFESLFWQVHLNSDEAWTHYEAETLWWTLESVSYSTSSSSTTEEGSDTGELYFGALWPTRNKLPFLIWEVNGRINPQM